MTGPRLAGAVVVSLALWVWLVTALIAGGLL